MAHFRKIKTKNRRIKSDILTVNRTEVDTRRGVESFSVKEQIPIVWESAKGHTVYGTGGNKWIDFTSGIFVANAGHSNSKVKKAIIKQTKNNMLFSFTYLNRTRIELMLKLSNMFATYPKNTKVILLNTGSEATDMAYKLMKYWAKKHSRKYIIVFQGSYHGRVLSSDLMCENSSSTSWSNFVDKEILFVPFPKEKQTIQDLLATLPIPLKTLRSEIAAFFLETYQGWSAKMYPEPFLKSLNDFLELEKDILLGFDEVQSGFWRMGTPFGFQSYHTEMNPDFICVGKGITSSLPLAAVIGTDKFIDIERDLVAGATHPGNPVSCAAALANIDFLEKEYRKNNFQSLSSFFSRPLTLMKDYPFINEVNNRGMVCGLLVDTAARANRIVLKCAQRGLLLVQTFKNSIKMGPPLTIADDALLEGMSVFFEVLDEELS